MNRTKEVVFKQLLKLFPLKLQVLEDLRFNNQNFKDVLRTSISRLLLQSFHVLSYCSMCFNPLNRSLKWSYV